MHHPPVPILVALLSLSMLLAGCGGPCGTVVEAVTQDPAYFDLMAEREPPAGWTSKLGNPHPDYYIPWEGTLTHGNRTLQGVYFYRFEEKLGTFDGFSESVSGLAGSDLLRFDLAATRSLPDRERIYREGLERYAEFGPAETDAAVERLKTSETATSRSIVAIDRQTPIKGVAGLFDSLGLTPSIPTDPDEHGITLTYGSATWDWTFNVATRTWSKYGPTQIIADQFGNVKLLTDFSSFKEHGPAVQEAKARFNESGLPSLDVADERWESNDYCS